jgi:predicted permease
MLFVRSMQRAHDVDPGFQTKNLAIVLTNPGQAGYTKPQTRAFYQAVRDRVATLPGIASVSWASNLPLWGRLVGGLRVEGHEASSRAETITTVINTVDVMYFETAGIPMIAGRPFTEIDLADSTPVAVVNDRAARDFWPGQSALGRRIQLPSEHTARQIIGVARTANYSTLAEPPQYCVYLPLEQHYTDAMTLYVRSHGEPEQILRSVQREMLAVAPEISVTDVRTGKTILDAALFQARMGVALLGVLGLLALGLASVGLYGIMAYSVSQRTREIGMRMALGAARNDVLRLILQEGMSMVGLGVLIGFGVSLLTGRLLTRMLYGIGGSDPMSVTGAASILVLAAAAACYWPARRASGLDPLVALRQG